MASRPLMSPYAVVSAGDMSANITGKVSLIPNISQVSYSCVWSGTSPVGTLKVQISNRYSLNEDGSVANAGDDWSDLSTQAVSGNTGIVVFNLSQVSAYAIRLVYAFTSGVGTLNATVNGKVM